MSEYFVGRRDVCSFKLELDKGKGVIECTVSERWHPILHDCLKCGAKAEYTLKKTTGIRASEKASVENSIQASIGVKDLAQIKAVAKEQLSTEVCWESAQEEARSVTFVAPQCGRYIAAQYQKVRDYHFRYQRKGWLHRDSWQSYFTEYTNYYHDDSKSVDIDPDCRCNPKMDTPDYDGLLRIDFGHTSMLAPYRRTQKGIELELAGQRAEIEATGHSLFFLTLPIEYIPQSLVFLGDMKDKSYEATVSPYTESDIIDEVGLTYEIEPLELVISPLSSGSSEPEEMET